MRGEGGRSRETRGTVSSPSEHTERCLAIISDDRAVLLEMPLSRGTSLNPRNLSGGSPRSPI